MNLRDLAYLVAIADHGSLRKAAVACAVAQPTLSAQIKRLEADLGATLLDRATTPISLTPVGEDVVARARHILRDAADLREAARPHPTGEAATVRLGVIPTLGAYLMPTVLAGIGDRLPHIDLLLTERKTTALLGLLDSGDLDAIIIALPITRTDLAVRPLFREDFLLVVPGRHELARRPEPVPATALTDTEMILLTDGHCLADQVSDWLSTIGGHWRSDYRASSLESLRSMIAAGTGATLLPALAVAHPGPLGDAMVTRAVTDPTPSRDLALVWRRGSARTDLLADLAPALVPDGAAHVSRLAADQGV